MTVWGPLGVLITIGIPAFAVQSPVIVGSEDRLGVGAVVSFTVTVKLVLAPSGSLLHVTRVSPTSKNDPDGRSQLIVPQVPPSDVGAE
jgi:hypothetical protein